MSIQRFFLPTFFLLLCTFLALPSAADSAAPIFSWQGTAPFCEGGPADCGGVTLYPWGPNHSGDGAPCWSGNKELCSNVPITDYQNLVWIGTAPFCDGKPSDCTDRGLEFLLYGTSGDGSECDNGGIFYGMKVLCGKRRPSNPAMDIRNTNVRTQTSADSLCPGTCSGEIWNGQFAPEALNPYNLLCGTTNGYDIPVGFFDGQAGADQTCQQRMSLMRWNGQWNPGVCGCQPAALIPPPNS